MFFAIFVVELSKHNPVIKLYNSKLLNKIMEHIGALYKSKVMLQQALRRITETKIKMNTMISTI